jgi:hypothetical protein
MWLDGSFFLFFGGAKWQIFATKKITDLEEEKSVVIFLTMSS